MGSTVWQSQTLDAPRISLEFVRHQTERLNADLRHEMIGAYLGLIVSVVALIWSFFGLPAGVNELVARIIRFGVLLGLPASIYIAFQIKRGTKKLHVVDGSPVIQSLNAYREELERRQHFYAGVLGWNALPILPSAFLIIIGGLSFDHRPDAEMRFGLFALVVTITSLVGGWYYRSKLRRFRRELDALTTMDAK